MVNNKFEEVSDIVIFVLLIVIVLWWRRRERFKFLRWLVLEEELFFSFYNCDIRKYVFVGEIYIRYIVIYRYREDLVFGFGYDLNIILCIWG